MANLILNCNDFINTYQYSSGIVFKDINTSQGWNAFAKGISPFVKNTPGIGVWFTPPSVQSPSYSGQNIQFSFGLSSDFPNINISDYYQQFEVGFYFNIGPNGNFVYPIINGNILTSENIPYSQVMYGLEFDSEGNLDLTLTNVNTSNKTVLYSLPVNSGSLQVTFPLYIYIYSYNTYTYPLLFNVNYTGNTALQLTNISPDISQPIGLMNSMFFTFNQPLNQSTINTNNIQYFFNGQELTKYIVKLINSNTVEIDFGYPRNFNSVYEISFNNILSFSGMEYSGNISFITIPEESQTTEELLYNTNICDVYWTLNNIFELLDIDFVFSNDSENFNLSFNPTEYNPIGNDFQTSNNTDLNFNNQKIIIGLLQTQFLYYFSNYINNINDNNILKILFKNSYWINYYKGTLTQIFFLLNLLGIENSSYINEVISNEKFNYNIITSIPESSYVNCIEQNVHPLGFDYNFVNINNLSNTNFNSNLDINTLEFHFLFNINNNTNFQYT